MVICIIALVVCGILGIFSVKYRAIAKESFKCTFRLITFRPCNTNLDQRIKANITSKLLKRTPKLAKLVYRYFTLLSVVFVVIFFASMGYGAYALYNLGVHGTCNLKNPNECIFDPNAGEEQSCNLGVTHNFIPNILSRNKISLDSAWNFSKQYKSII